MKEETAKTKWCPMVRLLKDQNDPTVINNRGEHDMTGDSSIAQSANCIASDCMMWVWEGEYSNGRHTGGQPCTDGHCGLARSAGVTK